MARLYVNRHGHVGLGFGCFGAIIMVFVVLALAAVALTLVAGVVAIVLGVALAVLVVGGVARLVMALSPKRRAQRPIDAHVTGSRLTTGGIDQKAINAAQRREDKLRRRGK
jgi:uncharacterized membrane protein YccC